MVVKAELEKLGLNYSSVELGEVELPLPLNSADRENLKVALLRSGLELMDDKKSVLIQKIKTIIIEMVHFSDEPLRITFSNYLSQK